MAHSFTIASEQFNPGGVTPPPGPTPNPWDMEDLIIGTADDNIVIAKYNLCHKGPISDTNTLTAQYSWGNNRAFYTDTAYEANTSLVSSTAFSRSNPYSGPWKTISSGNQDRANPQKDSLWGGTQLDTDYTVMPTAQQEIEKQGPCPDGYHIPTYEEWNKFLILYARAKGMEDRLVKNAQGYVTGTTSTANSAAFVTAIKADCNWATTLPVVRQTNATVTSTTNVISVWTSTVVTTYSKIGILNPGSVTRNATNPRFIGMAIRPFKNRFS